jgi:hypothetical protein
MTESEVRAQAEKLSALKSLLASPGWQYLCEAIDQDVVRAAYGMAVSAQMTGDEMHFRRGAIFAAQNFKNVPDRLTQKIENDLMMEAAQAMPDPAMAGEDNHGPD